MPNVTFMTDEKTYEVPQGKDLKELCHETQASLPFSCQNGDCGTCIIEVIDGAENLTPMESKEKQTLEMNSADSSKCHLACQCKVKGDVKFSNYY